MTISYFLFHIIIIAILFILLLYYLDNRRIIKLNYIYKKSWSNI